MTRLIIARHGNTFSPGETPRRVGARTDIPLTESGMAQAMALGLHLRASNLVPDIVFTSQLRRTKETAGYALEAMDRHIASEPLAIFNELDYGPDENKPEPEVVARLGEQALKNWDEKAVVPPGWNIDPDLIIRSWIDFAATMRTQHPDKTILVVTSNGTARFAPHILPDAEAFRTRFPLKLATGAFGVLQTDGDQWKAVCWNERP